MKVPLSTVAAEYIGFIVAFSANIFLIFLILTQTKQNFGSYKYLMLWFSLFSLWYSLIDIMTQPAMHTHKNAFIVICASWFKYDKFIGEIMATTYVTSYGLTVVLLAIHFVYRYIAISRPSDLCYFQYPLALIWPAIFFSVAIIWWGVVYIFMGITDIMNDYMRETIMINYEDDIGKLAYIAPLYYIIEPDGTLNLQWPVCIGMLYIMTVSSASFAVIVTLGFKIHQKMRRVQDMLAEKTRELQRQLFYSLMVQTIVPSILMFSPVSIISLSPVFGIELGRMANITSICLALYPALDPLVVMLFIRDYRKYILKKLCKHNLVSPSSTRASITTKPELTN